MAEAGARFESYVRAAMTEGEIESMAELGRRSGIAAPIWYSWFRGEKQPRRTSLTLAGQALDRTPDQLLAVWDGDRPHKPRGATQGGDAVAEAIARQTVVLEEIRDLLSYRLTPEDQRIARELEQAASPLPRPQRSGR